MNTIARSFIVVACAIAATAFESAPTAGAEAQLPKIGVTSEGSVIQFVAVSCYGQGFGHAVVHAGLGEGAPRIWELVLNHGSKAMSRLPLANMVEGYEAKIPLTVTLSPNRLHTLYAEDQQGAVMANFAFNPGDVREGSVLTYKGRDPAYDSPSSFASDFCRPRGPSSFVSVAVTTALGIASSALLVALGLRFFRGRNLPS